MLTETIKRSLARTSKSEALGRAKETRRVHANSTGEEINTTAVLDSNKVRLQRQVLHNRTTGKSLMKRPKWTHKLMPAAVGFLKAERSEQNVPPSSTYIYTEHL